MKKISMFAAVLLIAAAVFMAAHRRETASPSPATNRSETPAPELSASTNASTASAPQAPPASSSLETTESARGSSDVSPAAPVTGVDDAAAAADEKYRLLRELRAWAGKDPEAALAAAMKLPEGDERNEALEAVCFGVAESRPGDAVALAASLHLDARPGAMMESLVQQWAAADLPAAADWARDLPAGNERDQFLSRIAFVESQGNPADAARRVVEQMSPGAAQDEAAMSVLHQWASRDVASAAEWVRAFPEGPLRERALRELEGILQHQDAMAAQAKGAATKP